MKAKQAGLKLEELRGVASDGTKGLLGYLELGLWWVNHQRCQGNRVFGQMRCNRQDFI